eukprot:1541880-Rhodomonas_salina.1
MGHKKKREKEKKRTKKKGRSVPSVGVGPREELLDSRRVAVNAGGRKDLVPARTHVHLCATDAASSVLLCATDAASS